MSDAFFRMFIFMPAVLLWLCTPAQRSGFRLWLWRQNCFGIDGPVLSLVFFCWEVLCWLVYLFGTFGVQAFAWFLSIMYSKRVGGRLQTCRKEVGEIQILCTVPQKCKQNPTKIIMVGAGSCIQVRCIVQSLRQFPKRMVKEK